MSWKTALYNYVHAKNQAELEGTAEPLDALIADKIHVQRQHARLSRLKQSFDIRGAAPARVETKLRLTDVREAGGEVIADIRLHRRYQYKIGSAEHLEERVELERVALHDAEGRWRVRRLETGGAERSKPGKARGGSHGAAQEAAAGARLPSLPYINYSILNSVESLSRKISYDRAKAVAYAETWWNQANPRYLEFEVDCTNFVSQCLFAGGAPMDYTGKREAGWWYEGKHGNQELWSYSWAVAHSLQLLLSNSRSGLKGTAAAGPQELQPGDVICYDWDGDGRFQHNAIVTAKDANGMPLVNAHTYNCRSRYWEYRDSPAWTERTRYSFVRIADEF